VAITVTLVNLGEQLSPGLLERLAAKLNKLQHSFAFAVGQPISSVAMGDPQMDRQRYDCEALFSVLRTAANGTARFLVGVTHAQIGCLDPQGSDLGDYFSQSDATRCSMISIHPNILHFNAPGKSDEQYLAYLLMCELLINLAQEDLSHRRAEHCLFFDCDNREEFAPSMRRGRICALCRGKLSEKKVSNAVIEDVQVVLTWCAENTWNYAWSRTVANPLATVALGLGLGWAASVFLPGTLIAILVATLITLGVPGAVLIYSKRRA
jgi:hypothetical protein